MTSPLAAFEFLGKAADGRREWGFAVQVGTGSKQRTAAMFCRDGEAPVVSTVVDMELRWAQNPTNPLDVTVTEAHVAFEGKELRYTGSFSSLPGGRIPERLNIHGTLGAWSERESAPAVQSLGWCETHANAGDVIIG
jgi:hypothetical protein